MGVVQRQNGNFLWDTLPLFLIAMRVQLLPLTLTSQDVIKSSNIYVYLHKRGLSENIDLEEL